MSSFDLIRLAESSGDAVLRSAARFHRPLIEPDVRISLIRLSDRISRVRPPEVARSAPELREPQLLVQLLVGEA